MELSRSFIVLLTLAALLLLSIATVGGYFDIEIAKFTRDPMSVAHGHPFYGFLSNIGVILWSSAMAICFFTFFVLRSYQAPKRTLWFIISGGMLGLMLLLDDLFMLHEWIYPRNLGIPEKLVSLSYVVLLFAYTVVFFGRIIDSSFMYLVSLFFFFGISMLVDKIPSTVLTSHFLLEDGAKFLGIVSWLFYHFSVSRYELRRSWEEWLAQNTGTSISP